MLYSNYFEIIYLFNFMGTKFREYDLNIMGMFVDTWIGGFQIKHNIANTAKVKI